MNLNDKNNMVEKRSVKNNKVIKIFNLLGDETRLRIICFVLNKSNICVSDIARGLGLSVATTSHHLRTLSVGGLLVPKRNGKMICYQFPHSPLTKDLKKFICKYK